MDTPTPKMPDIEAMMALTARFEAARADDPALADAELDQLLRLVPGKRAILRGRFGDHRAVFRIFDDLANPAPAREWAEMRRIWPHMQDGPSRVAQPLHFSPKHGIVTMSFVPGTPLMQHMWGIKSDARARYLAPAADWLRAYTRTSETTAPNRFSAWLSRAEKAAAGQPHDKLRKREAVVLRQLHRLVPILGDRPWRSAICHGDFHPNNLLLEGDRLTGIDTGGSGRMPVYKDIARFLMHMGRRGLIPSEVSRFGVDAEGIKAFAQAFDLDDWESGLALPFMLGCEALIRVEHPKMQRSRIRHAAQMYDQLIPDLRQL